MATMFLNKNAFVNVPQNMAVKPSFSIRHQASRVCFTTRVAKSDGGKLVDEITEAGADASAKTNEALGKAGERAAEGFETSKGQAESLKESTADKVKEGLDSAGETVGDLDEQAKKSAGDAWESAKGATEKLKDAVSEKVAEAEKEVKKQADK